MLPDEKLVGHVRAGSQAAFEVVYDRHHRGILSFCRHMLASPTEAEDAVQHTFMAAYRDMVGSEKELQLRAWLYTIARNRCLSILRARREHPTDEIDDIPTEGLADQVQRRQDLKDMLHDLAGLPENQRAALVLSELGAMPHDEIAAVIGCPKDKVKALVFQARTSLHSSRDARETDCSEIRELIANLSGGSLRRTQLRRHLRDCTGCKEFAADVKRQRASLAVLLPVVPAFGLKEQALAAAFGSTAAGGTAVVAGTGTVAAGTGFASGATAIAAKVLVVVAVGAGGVAGGVAGVNAIDGSGPPASNSSGAGPNTPTPLPAVTTPEPTPDASDRSDRADEKASRARDRKAKAKADRERGKALAITRGKGEKRGLRGTQPGQSAAKRAELEARRAARDLRRAAARRRKSQTPLVPRSTPTPTSPVRPQRTPKATPTAAAVEPTPTATPTEKAKGKSQ